MTNRNQRARLILGGWLSANREKFGYTQGQIAEWTGITQSRQSKLENATGDLLPMEIAAFLQLYRDGEPFPWEDLQRLFTQERRARIEFTESLMGLYLAGLVSHDGNDEIMTLGQAS